MEVIETAKETLNETETIFCPIKITYSKNDKVAGRHDGIRKRVVYKGQFNGEIPVAIKVYQGTGDDKEFNCVKQSLKILSLTRNRHPNFIRYYGASEDNGQLK